MGHYKLLMESSAAMFELPAIHFGIVCFLLGVFVGWVASPIFWHWFNKVLENVDE